VRIGRLADVRAMCAGISRPTIDRWEANEGFPKRIRLGPAAVGWDLDAVAAWLEARPRGVKPPPQVSPIAGSQAA
jgi:predicted DNA-binding transcriptional regulator AlpA